MLFKRRAPVRKKAYSVRLHIVVHEKVVTLSPTGLKVTPDLTWLEIASTLKFFIRSRYFIYWCIGDLFNYAVSKFGVNRGFIKSIYTSKESSLHRFGQERIQLCMRVAAGVPYEMRLEELHPHIQYYMFTMMDKKRALQILKQGIEEDWTTEQFIEERGIHYPVPGKFLR